MKTFAFGLLFVLGAFAVACSGDPAPADTDSTSGAATTAGCKGSSYFAVIVNHDHRGISGMAVKVRGDEQTTDTQLTTRADGTLYYESDVCSANATVTAYVDNDTTASLKVRVDPYFSNSPFAGSARDVPYLLLDKDAKGVWTLTRWR